MELLKGSLNLLQAAAFVNKWRHPCPNGLSTLSTLSTLSGFSRLNKRSSRALAAIIILAAIFINPPKTSAASVTELSAIQQRQLQGLISHGAYGLAREGSLPASANLELPLIPASIIKLLTALVAFEQLGIDYRFKTEFFIDDRGNLYIKGYGDPFLISEEIERIMLSLKESGCGTINNINLDDSSYRLRSAADGVGDSLNPYDVASSALAVNFNTINIVVDRDGTVRSGEPQTPLLPLMTRLGKNLPPGEHRINISGEPTDSLLLAGQLFRSFQKKAGIGGQGEILRGQAPAGEPFYTHYSSKTLLELVEGLMLYSNNFIANQIFLQSGAIKFGYPATWEKGKNTVRDYINRDPVLKTMAITVEEGSGISRENRLTVRALLRILLLFKPHARLLPAKGDVLLKSGTLTGVYSYAGYLPDKDGLDSFAIILNQNKNNRDDILEILRKIHLE
jgi:D-alanyl-D-alanine carboxypeptidase/D-alanyl-D-alanine-endopeptidase (penicillin-binding protein 4)